MFTTKWYLVSDILAQSSFITFCTWLMAISWNGFLCTARIRWGWWHCIINGMKIIYDFLLNYQWGNSLFWKEFIYDRSAFFVLNFTDSPSTDYILTETYKKSHPYKKFKHYNVSQSDSAVVEYWTVLGWQMIFTVKDNQYALANDCSQP